jgi:hypothetical protein
LIVVRRSLRPNIGPILAIARPVARRRPGPGR